MSSILKVYFYNLNVFANVEHEKFVLRKPNTSPITNHFAWRIMQKKKSMYWWITISLQCVCVSRINSLWISQLCSLFLRQIYQLWICSSVVLYDRFSVCCLCDSCFNPLTFVSCFFVFLFVCLGFFLCAVFSCFYFIWVMFHSCCSFLRRQWMYKYEIQFLYCLLMFPNLQEACYLCSF